MHATLAQAGEHPGDATAGTGATGLGTPGGVGSVEAEAESDEEVVMAGAAKAPDSTQLTPCCAVASTCQH